MILNREKRSLVLSLLLGDGCLHWSKNHNSTTGYLHIKHSLKQEDYLMWKIGLLAEALNKKDLCILESESYVKALDKKYKNKRVQLGMRRFRTWYKIFYPNRKKNLPKMLDYITHHQLACAIWLGDDGSISTGRLRKKEKNSPRRANGLIIYTCDQTEEDTQKLIEWFDKYFHVKAKLKYHACIYKGEHKKYPIIRFNFTETMKLWKEVREILLKIPSMRQKFGALEERYQEFCLQPPAQEIVKT